jgi:hypothetical protein
MGAYIYSPPPFKIVQELRPKFSKTFERPLFQMFPFTFLYTTSTFTFLSEVGLLVTIFHPGNVKFGLWFTLRMKLLVTMVTKKKTMVALLQATLTKKNLRLLPWYQYRCWFTQAI